MKAGLAGAFGRIRSRGTRFEVRACDPAGRNGLLFSPEHLEQGICFGEFYAHYFPDFEY